MRTALLVLLAAASGPAWGQAPPAPPVQAAPAPQTAVYIEALGNAGGASVNLERRVLPRGAVRVGVGAMVTSVDLNRFVLAAPVMVLRTPAEGRGLVLGVGVVPRYDVAGVLCCDAGGVRAGAGFAETFFTATAGYRWADPNGSGVYQVSFTPLYVPSGARSGLGLGGWIPSAGFSFGAGW